MTINNAAINSEWEISEETREQLSETGLKQSFQSRSSTHVSRFFHSMTQYHVHVVDSNL